MRGSHEKKIDEDEQQPQLSCKIRLLDTLGDTVGFARQLQHAGCDMLSVHCRRREVKREGLPDYKSGAFLVSQLDIPVVINGNVTTLEEAQRLLLKTKAQAIMVARGFLENPLMLVSDNDEDNNNNGSDNLPKSPLFMAAAYLDHCEIHPPPSLLYISKHLRLMFRKELEPENKHDPKSYNDWKERLCTFLVRPYLETIDQFRQILAFYARHKLQTNPAMTVPESLVGLPEASLHDIQYTSIIELNVKNNEEEALRSEGGFALGLFEKVS